MAETITYKPADVKKFYDAGWNGKGYEIAPNRAHKMVRPMCKTCQGDPTHTTLWWQTCPHFKDVNDKYWRFQPKIIKKPEYGTDEDGDMVLLGEDVVTKMIRIPNLTEVITSESHNAGQGPRMFEVHGWKFLPEVGIAPMCQFYGCGKSWPTLHTEEYGDYCSEYHAKLVIAGIEGVVLTEAVQTDRAKKIRRQQLAAIVI